MPAGRRAGFALHAEVPEQVDDGAAQAQRIDGGGDSQEDADLEADRAEP